MASYRWQAIIWAIGDQEAWRQMYSQQWTHQSTNVLIGALMSSSLRINNQSSLNRFTDIINRFTARDDINRVPGS